MFISSAVESYKVILAISCFQVEHV